MSNSKHFLSLSIFFLLSFIFGCKWFKPQVEIPDLPYLKNDTINSFKIGERFIISESKNSCCTNCFMKFQNLTNQMPTSSLYKLVETIEKSATPDCDGCSSYLYNIYECISVGTDTLMYFVIPMGVTHGVADCETINTDSLKDVILNNESNAFLYIIKVHN